MPTPETIAAIREEYEKLKARFPAMAGCINILDEPAGDFGIAHAWWNQYQNCPAHVSFDVGYNPTKKTIRHELMHLLCFNWAWKMNNGNYGPLMEMFWKARGYPGTAAESDAKAASLVNVDQWKSWQHWSLEIFAEDLTACLSEPGDSDYPGYSMAQDYGVPLDEPKVLSWLETVKVEEPQMALTDAEIQQIRGFIDEAISKYGTRLQDLAITPMQTRLDGIETVLNGFRAIFDKLEEV